MNNEQEDIFNFNKKDPDFFKDYAAENSDKEPLDKRKWAKIVIASIIIFMIVAGAFIAGIITGKNTGIESDMPLMVETYNLLKKYYYKDIDWEEFQQIASQAMMGSVDNFTGMYAYDYTTGQMALGITMSTDMYHNHNLSFIIPGSPADLAVAQYSYSSLEYEDEVDISSSNIKLSMGDKIYAIGINDLAPSKVEGVNASVLNDLISKSEDVVLYIMRSDGAGGYLDGLYAFPISKTYVESKAAYYYDATEIGDTSNSTAMIKLTSFTGTAIKDFSLCVDAFIEDGYKNLILDLRGNGGGDADILSYISGCLLVGADGKSENIAYYKYNAGNGKYSEMFFTSATSSVVEDNEGNETTYEAKNLPSKVEDFKMTILCDGGSASCSEVLIGALTYYNDTVIIGAKTYGKGVAQTVRPIGDGTYYVAITNGKYYIPTKNENGNVEWTKSIHGVGFTPETENIMPSVYRPYTSDVCIQRALTILG